jgi:hypothetical protein
MGCFPIMRVLLRFDQTKRIAAVSRRVEKIQNDEKEDLRKYAGSPPCDHCDRYFNFQRRYIPIMDLSGFLNEYHADRPYRFR